MELAFDTSKLVIFDADSGANLTIPSEVPAREEQPTPQAEEQTPPPVE